MSHRARRALRVLSIAAAVSGCAGPVVSYMATPSGQKPAPAREPTCDFAVTATVPTGPYEEVGTVRLGSRTASTYRGTLDPAEFKEAIRGDVCRLGGDIVVMQVDQGGTIIRGAILHKSAPDNEK